MIYFQLEDDPSILSANNIAVGIKYTSNQIYVGQLLFYTADALPIASAPVSSVHGYKENTTTIAVTGGSFSVANYVLKVPPSSSYGYNFETSI